MSEDNNQDWRIALFGPSIQQNQSECHAEECPITLIPTQQAFDTDLYDYIAVFIGANYCPHCKEFAPTVVSAALKTLQPHKRCKVIFVSNDRDGHDNFRQSCNKVAGIDVMPYDLEKTATMRDLFGLKTIPALMILRNQVGPEFGMDANVSSDDLLKSVPVVTNARHLLPNDIQCDNFPWGDKDAAGGAGVHGHTGMDKAQPMSNMDRFIISGKYGNWWDLGHSNVNPDKPDEIYMDEHAVRARAGLLNVITWIALMNVFFWNDKIYVQVLFPLVAWEFLSSMVFGLTPLAPIGIAGTLLSILLHPEGPYWKPARPKRFAWLIGLTLACTCLTLFVLRKEMDKDLYKPLIASVVLTCNVATWLESSVGFCLGCFIYNTYLVNWFEGLEECEECKL